MTYATPLTVRRRISERRKRRYQDDLAYRLARINATRVSRGHAPIASLDEMGSQGGIRPGHKRDQSGRFA